MTAEDDRLRALRELDVLDTPREERFDRVVRLAQRLFDVPMAAVSLIEKDRQWHKANAGLDGFQEGPRADAFCAHTIEQQRPFVVGDATADRRFRDNPFVTKHPHIRFYAGQPLSAPGGQLVGALCILDVKPRQISDDELALLRDLGSWVEKELAIDEDLVRASEVQRALLPRSAPVIPGYDVAGRCFPARDVSGDFFDYYMVDGALQLTIADVMGKGVAAAIIGAGIRAVLRAASRFNNLVDMINRSATALEPDLTDTSTFVTGFSARLTPETGRFEWVDAGHGLSAVLRADGTVDQLASENLPLGLSPDQNWDGHVTELRPGDSFVSVSDGLLDYFDNAAAAAQAVDWLVRQSGSAEEAVDNIGRLQHDSIAVDDLTVLVARRTA